MSIHAKVAQTRQTAAKAAAAYATYKTAKASCLRAAEQFAHVWRVDGLYAETLSEAAFDVATETQAKIPGKPTRTSVGETYGQGERFSATTWALLRGLGPGVQARKASSDAIEFRAYRLKDLRKLQERVKQAALKLEEDALDISIDYEPRYNTTIYGWNTQEKGWSYLKERHCRSFNSVLIPAELQAEIEADLTRFSESRQRLNRLEMPWRRGYLLSGPPGTGKTSLSLAIAGALRFNLASLSLTDMTSDGMLRKAISNLPQRTVLVIEDIDANAVSHERDHNAAQDGALSLSGLLNSLDGFETPDGLVTILTTNHIEKLDAALVRSGRMDRTFHLGHIEAPELERLFQWFYEQPAPAPAPEYTGETFTSPADVAELFKQHLNDPEAGWQAVLDHLTPPLHIAV